MTADLYLRLPAAPPTNPRARTLLEEVLDRLPASDSRARALALARETEGVKQVVDQLRLNR